MKHKILWDFVIQTGNPIPTRISELVLSKRKKKKTCQQVDFVVPVNHKVKQILGSYKRDEKKLWNMKMTVITIIVGALGKLINNIEKRLDGPKIKRRIETI